MTVASVASVPSPRSHGSCGPRTRPRPRAQPNPRIGSPHRSPAPRNGRVSRDTRAVTQRPVLSLRDCAGPVTSATRARKQLFWSQDPLFCAPGEPVRRHEYHLRVREPSQRGLSSRQSPGGVALPARFWLESAAGEQPASSGLVRSGRINPSPGPPWAGSGEGKPRWPPGTRSGRLSRSVLRLKPWAFGLFPLWSYSSDPAATRTSPGSLSSTEAQTAVPPDSRGHPRDPLPGYP